MAVLLVYLLFMGLEIPLIFKTGYGSVPADATLPRTLLVHDDGVTRTVLDPHRVFHRTPERRMRETKRLSGLLFNETIADSVDEFSVLHKAAKQAWLAGKKLWEELESGKFQPNPIDVDNRTEHCPVSITSSSSEFLARNRTIELPCGLTLGSHITVVGSPRWAHKEKDPKIALLKEGGRGADGVPVHDGVTWFEDC